VSAIKHASFPFSIAMFTKVKIVPEPLTFIKNKVLDLRSLGQIGNQLTFNQTKDKISLMQSHLPLYVCFLVLYSYLTTYAYHFFQTEAGCHILINAILLHVVSNLSGADINVGIIPKFQIESTHSKHAATCYGNIVDFLIVKGPLNYIRKY
jgi:hypothetical protein